MSVKICKTLYFSVLHVFLYRKKTQKYLTNIFFCRTFTM